MKILHTADWHLGKRLYQKELHKDHRLFFQWLVKVIEEYDIDVLLVSGDIFDLANPSSGARQLYYNALSQLAATGVQMVITGGNHDSPAMLNAPRELLSALNISVTGSLPEHPPETLVPLGPKDSPSAVVAAVPFIRDNDLRRIAPEQSYDERTAAIRDGIREIFQEAARALKTQYPHAVPIAMGHLFAHGASVSDSEREIQVGNQAGIDSAAFPREFQYIALGHIHRPQKAGADHILYSGSPIPLSFSETTDEKRVVIIEFEAGVEHIRSIPVPRWRKLLRIAGNFEEVITRLARNEYDTELPSFIEIELKQPARNPKESLELEKRVEEFNNATHNAEIIKYFIKISGQEPAVNTMFHKTRIEDLQPGEVFIKWLERSETDPQTSDHLHEAFEELLQDYYQSHDR